MTRETAVFLVGSALALPAFLGLVLGVPWGRRDFSRFLRLLNGLLLALMIALIAMRYVRAAVPPGGALLAGLRVVEAAIVPFYGCLLGVHVWLNRHYFLTPFWRRVFKCDPGKRSPPARPSTVPRPKGS